MYTIIGVLMLVVAWLLNRELDRDSSKDWLLLLIIPFYLSGSITLMIGLYPLLEVIK